MKSKNKKLFIIATISIIICLMGIVYAKFNLNDHLTEKEIQSLRETYPICGIVEPENFSIKEVTLEEYIRSESIDSFVYGEVVGDISLYTKGISTGYLELDEKFVYNGIGIEHDFYEYTVSVIKDTENRYNEGDLITITANALFKDYNPTLTDGMKVVVPVLENDASIGRNWFHVIGMYYVTENGYAISAYDEKEALTRSTLSGVKVESLLNELGNMIE